MKTIVLYFTCLIVLCVGGIVPANANLPFGGRAAGMGNAAVAIYDFWALSHNQAGLARISSPTAGFYFENRYLTPEMGFGALGFAMPAVGGVMGLSVGYFGFEHYNESKIGLTYSRAFGEKFSAAVQLNYLYTYIGDGYGTSGSVAAELGVIYEAFPGFQIGAHIFNPTRTRVSDLAPDRLPTIFRFGAAYQFSERVLATIETEKDLDKDPVFKAGIEYGITEQLFVRAGLGTHPNTNAFGLGLYLGNLKIDIATSFHHVLGYSPQVSLRYSFQ